MFLGTDGGVSFGQRWPVDEIGIRGDLAAHHGFAKVEAHVDDHL